MLRSVRLPHAALRQYLYNFAASSMARCHPDDAAGKRMALSVAGLDETDWRTATLISTSAAGATCQCEQGDASRGEDYYVNICSVAAVTRRATMHGCTRGPQ